MTTIFFGRENLLQVLRSNQGPKQLGKAPVEDRGSINAIIIARDELWKQQAQEILVPD